jgi:uncharacterized membrane protein
MHPFDIRSALLAKHAQHVVIIHFPIALFMIGVAFDWIAQLRQNAALCAAAYYNFLVAAVSVPIAVGSGILAWQLQLDGERLHGILLMHLLLSLASAALILLVWWIHYKGKGRSVPVLRLALEATAVIVIALTGHLGGFLSGVNT